MSEAIITVEGLGKKYRLGAQTGERYTALRDVVAEAAARPFRRLGAKVGKWKGKNGSSPSDRPTSEPSNLATLAPSHSSKEDFWALKDINFEVKQGEVLASGSEGPYSSASGSERPTPRRERLHRSKSLANEATTHYLTNDERNHG